MIDLTAYEKVWYVSDANGDVGNGGASWADAKKTVAQGLALMSSGQALLIGPGTYTEQNDFSALTGILIAGSGLATVLTFATGWTVKLGSAARVCDITINATKAVPISGEFGAVELTAATLAAPVFERVAIKSTDIGIRYLGDGLEDGPTDQFILRDSAIDAAEYGLQVSGTRHPAGAMQVLIERCMIFTDGWIVCATSAVAVNLACLVGITSLEIRDSTLMATSPSGAAAFAVAWGLAVSNSVRVVTHRTVVRAKNARDAADAHAYGIYNTNSMVLACDTMISTVAENATADEYDLALSGGGGSNVVKGCSYDAAKVYGALTDLDRLLSGANVDSTATETISVLKVLELIYAHLSGKTVKADGYTDFYAPDDSTALLRVTHDLTGTRSEGGQLL